MKMTPYFWPKNPKANYFAKALNVSCGKLKVYETDLDFSLKNAKANFWHRNRLLIYITQVIFTKQSHDCLPVVALAKSGKGVVIAVKQGVTVHHIHFL
jgi:hypothetical protein